MTASAPSTRHILINFHYGDGSGQYNLPVHLGPQASTMIDMALLIAEHKPEPDGHVIPSNIQEGSAEFASAKGRNENITLVIAAGIYNVSTATCGGGCISCCGVSNFGFSPANFFCPIGQTMQCSSTAVDCNGFSVFASSWSSSNTAVMTVTGSGVVRGISLGQATITANFGSVIVYTGQLCSGGSCPSAYVAPSAPGNVTPKITSISPAKGPIGATTSVTISGQGFGTSPSVNAGSNITVTINSKSDTQIQANFAVSSSAAGGNQAVTVTASGQTSNSVNFFVQIPTSLSVLSSQVISMSSYCPDPSKTYGILVAIHYQLLDQNSASVASSAMEPQEEVLNVVINGVNQGNTTPNWQDVGPSNYPGTSKFTDTNGQYWDAPLGICSSGTFTATYTQPVSILISGNRYPTGGGAVRTNNWSVQSSSSGHGSITNGTDVNQSH